MLKPRFSLVSVVAMVLAAAAATFATIGFSGGGFAGTRGFPFAWYWWTDMTINNSPSSGFRWLGLVADAIFWLVATVAGGFFVEWIAQKSLRRYEPTNAV